MNAPPKAYERFLSSLPAFSAQRSHGPNWRLYEELKRSYFEQATKNLATACQQNDLFSAA